MKQACYIFLIFCVAGCHLGDQKSPFGEPIILSHSVYDSASKNFYAVSAVPFKEEVSKSRCQSYLEGHEMEPIGINALNLIPIEKLSEGSRYYSLDPRKDMLTEVFYSNMFISGFTRTSDTSCHVSLVGHFNAGNHLLCFKKLN